MHSMSKLAISICLFLFSFSECGYAWGPGRNDPTRHTAHMDITAFA